MNKNLKVLFNGVIKENPIFVLLLGMCPPGNNKLRNQRMSMGLGNYVCFNMLKCSYFNVERT